MNEATDRPPVALAQRLWLLERRSTGWPWCDARRYVSAITILNRTRVQLLFVRSADAPVVAEACLDNPCLRLQVDRDARAFHSLDAAMAWADAARDAWIRRGWAEVPADPND